MYLPLPKLVFLGLLGSFWVFWGTFWVFLVFWVFLAFLGRLVFLRLLGVVKYKLSMLKHENFAAKH
jgi:hypothetical protein